MDKNSNALNWFEIPVTDLTRAKMFYETIFQIKMQIMPEMLGMKMAAFPGEAKSGKVIGAICESEVHEPSMDGAVIYLNANPSIQKVLDRIEPAGGQVLMPRTEITPETGYMAFFIDTEGNRIGLHAMQ
ncbi:VOC family protein [Chitinophagaceae bacterium LB-8]|uniref:VOC family protein n=1 Tax=Paraflavisolibacter caeni TaxID=2982496 RepID=A0A9X2XTJ0_9BACT|nr:VOC family protein [Paraflavisolibacter caeni]MCU7548072.1 VOC family protein [Paraflavisolibacter caeni]